MKRFLASPYKNGGRALLEGARSVGVAPEERVTWLRERFGQLEAAGDVAPAPLLTGDDLTEAGYKPGPKFKHVLEAVYDAQLEDRVRTKEEAIGMARVEWEKQPGPLDRR